MPNDTDKPSVEQLIQAAIQKHRLMSVTFLVEDYGRHVFVNAILERNPRVGATGQKVHVMALASTFVEAVARAEIVLEKVNNLELALGHVIESPDPKEQLFENGYCRKFVRDDIEVEFKRKDCRFVITGIRRKDAEGFYLHEPPLPIQGKMKFTRQLADGLELWEWDDLGILTGTAGECIVKDKMIIKSKTTRMA
jgi:hypothetical protein